MARKIIGYSELEWTCPNCSTKNAGSRSVCSACGAPQPGEVDFSLPASAPLIQNAAALTAAQRGPDVHCPYCGTRNLADAKQCVHCGGDLVEGQKRQAGRALVEQARPGAAVTCPACGAGNPSNVAHCLRCGAGLTSPNSPSTAAAVALSSAGKALSPAGTAAKASGAGFRPWMALPLVALLLVCCVALGYFFLRTEALSGVVQRVAWERTIEIETLEKVTRETWRDQVPTGAETLACRQEVRRTQDQPAENSREVCGTPYAVDKGNGYAETAQDCVYEIYDDYCQYSALEWLVTDKATARGENLAPVWPEAPVGVDRREGGRSEQYWAYFDTSKGTLEYQVDQVSIFEQFLPGSEWLLTVNGLGQVVDVVQP